uniref:Uncharacterized protein n=1 Tax=uncultured prokaryote TaxID=198431 RepID=A0A0H5Q654_9ZZZZ|nr:hypothetical protein [uncultured prokaryote]
MASLIQITLHTADAVSENFITNQFAVTGDVSSVPDSEALMECFKDFYDYLRLSAFPAEVAKNGHDFKLYIAGGAKPNYPLYESTFDFAVAPTGAGLPSEVAACLSFQGTRTPGSPQARRRGRVYIGPLLATTNTSGRPSSGLITNMIGAAQQLYDDIGTVTSAGSWAVWSPTDGLAVPITNGWVDNAFDTQRSRGLARTSRTLYSTI